MPKLGHSSKPCQIQGPTHKMFVSHKYIHSNENSVMHSVFSYFALLLFQTNLSVHYGVVDSSSPSQKKVFGSDTTTKVVGSVINPHGFSKEGKTKRE